MYHITKQVNFDITILLRKVTFGSYVLGTNTPLSGAEVKRTKTAV